MEDLGDVWDLITDLFDDNNNIITFTCVLRKNAIFDSSMPRFVTFRVHLDTTELTIYDTRSEEHLTAEEMEMEADHSGWLVCPKACRWHDMCPRELHCHPKSERLAHTLPSGCFLLS